MVARLRRAGCVFAEEEAQLLSAAAAGSHGLAVLVSRRVSGEPLEHILGWVEFDGLRLHVGPEAFVPRQRSVFLARLAVEAAYRHRQQPFLELCCGVGPLAAVVVRDVPGLAVVASDESQQCVRYARVNLPTSQVVVGDLFEQLPGALRGRVGVVAAVPPYVPQGAADELPQEARMFDSPSALFGGADGLDVVRRILDDAHEWLAPTGELLLELHRSQVPAAAAHAHDRGFNAIPEHHVDGQTVVICFAAAAE